MVIYFPKICRFYFEGVFAKCCFVRARCIASARTAQKTSLPIVACVSAAAILVYLVVTAQQTV